MPGTAVSKRQQTSEIRLARYSILSLPIALAECRFGDFPSAESKRRKSFARFRWRQIRTGIPAMGNKIARTRQGSASEYYLHDLPSSYNLVLKEILGRGRFFKTIQCKHDEGLVLVKVYFKRDDSIDLREYERRLLHIKETFRSIDHPHVWPFQVRSLPIL